MNIFSCKFVENLPVSIYCFYFHDWKDENEIICLICHQVKNQECAGGGALGRCQVTTAEGTRRQPNGSHSRKEDSSFFASLLIVLRAAAEHLQGNAK